MITTEENIELFRRVNTSSVWNPDCRSVNNMKTLVNKNKPNLVSKSLLLFVASSVLCACSGGLGTSSAEARARGPFRAEVAEAFEPSKVNQIVVVPLESGAGVALSAEDLELLTIQLLKAVEVNTSMEVLNSSRSELCREAFLKHSGKAQSLASRAKLIGNELGVQGVLYGVLSRYEKASGSSIGDEHPAGVGFSLSLIDPKSGELLWRGLYNESQRSLSENLFEVRRAFERGFAFQTADELFEQGIEMAAVSLESLRAQALSK